MIIFGTDSNETVLRKISLDYDELNICKAFNRDSITAYVSAKTMPDPLTSTESCNSTTSMESIHNRFNIDAYTNNDDEDASENSNEESNSNYY
jgi:hypothetical protein